MNVKKKRTKEEEKEKNNVDECKEGEKKKYD